MTPPTGPETEKRVSRACVSCRSRKTRCDLDSSGVPGDPPCRRCIEKNQECTLATSRRGGRRIKGQRLGYSRSTDDSHQASPSRPINRMNPVPAQEPREPDQHSEWLSSNLGSPLDQQSEDDEEPTGDAVRLKGHFTSSDLLNPSDALDLLAHVADMEPEGHAQTQDAEGDPENLTRMANTSQGVCDYPPVTSGALTLSEAAFLIEHYHDNFHIFFPIAYSAAFDSSRILELIEHEPYLITAILTVATKDDPSWSRAHNACARHMETQISKLIYTGSTTVGAVEALLILAEWAPQPLEENLMIGCGKEDQGSWMLVGVAIRLAYLQNLEQTGLVQRVEVTDGKTACYMSDRQVSIRLGKGFWSRGPGPSVNLRAADFPYLQTQKLGNDNLALLFQAHLEITQLFSNAHDILYSSTSHREQLYIGGEYVRYIDDFSSVLRRWKLSWGGLSFIPRVKASLMLSYDFLRLYINAFAFQANLNRIVRRSKKRPSGPLFSELAAAPDARFIYESIDAANSILCTLNSFIDPTEAFKYMPLKFYLYVIYAAVFLFKAIFAGAIKPSEARGVRRAIYETISRLQKTSNNQQGLGQRYARSLRLLWLKMLGKSRSRNPEVEGRSDSLALASHGALQSQAESSEGHMNSDPFNSFSWKDLHSLGEFISNDGTSLFNDNFIISPEQDSPTSLASHLTSPAGNLSYSRFSRVVRLIAWQEVLVLIPSAVMTPLKALSTPQPHRAILAQQTKLFKMATSQSKDLPSSSYFSAFAANYLQQTGRSTYRVLDLAFDSIQATRPITKGSVVHDNAAGPGIAALVLVDRLAADDVPQILVTDNVPPMVQAAKDSFTSFPQIEAKVLDSQNLEGIPDEHFTHSILNFSVYTLADPVKGVKEIYRTLQPDGLAAISCWKRFGVGKLIHAAQALVRPDLPPLKIPHPEFFEPGVLEKTTIEAGFDSSKFELVEDSIIVSGPELEDGLKKFMLGDLMRPARAGYTNEEEKRWPEAVDEVLKKEVESYGGVKFESWVLLAQK
ncbi:hypothetical protein FOFC_16468 [Fusarium oxysporum]|nr:hypothetical protein FOFC_16468 [Fusarium oxysporum]